MMSTTSYRQTRSNKMRLADLATIADKLYFHRFYSREDVKPRIWILLSLSRGI